jgi:hypothetical protein
MDENEMQAIELAETILDLDNYLHIANVIENNIWLKKYCINDEIKFLLLTVDKIKEIIDDRELTELENSILRTLGRYLNGKFPNNFTTKLFN